jgi:hypothetical protein
VQALTDAAGGHWPHLLHLAILGLWGAAMSILAVRKFSWE